jgi:hypothetical protein
MRVPCCLPFGCSLHWRHGWPLAEFDLLERCRIRQASVTIGPRFRAGRRFEPQAWATLYDNVFALLEGLGCTRVKEHLKLHLECRENLHKTYTKR